MPGQPWKVSLHGGHSGQFCEHAQGTLRQMLEAALQAGYRCFGMTEHAPRPESRFLYPSEIEKGMDVKRLRQDFEGYARESLRLQREFDSVNGMAVLRGFEIEVLPASGYAETMLELRRRHEFDYIVGSVHFVDELWIDGPQEEFEKAIRELGGLEELALRYYHLVAEMVEALLPEVVGHLDLLRLNASDKRALETPRVRRAIEQALQAVREQNGILDLNTAGYRKGLGTPYPDAWLVRLAGRMGIGFCFGDDSHRPEDVGAGLEEARGYLLDNGIDRITSLVRRGGELLRESVSLG